MYCSYCSYSSWFCPNEESISITMSFSVTLGWFGLHSYTFSGRTLSIHDTVEVK